MSAGSYRPKWGVPLQVLEFLQSNPDEALSDTDVAVKFDTTPASVAASLRPSLQAGILRRERDEQSGYLVYVLGPGQGRVGFSS